MPGLQFKTAAQLIIALAIATLVGSVEAHGQTNSPSPNHPAAKPLIQWHSDQATATTPSQPPVIVDNQVRPAEHSVPIDQAAPLAGIEVEVPALDPTPAPKSRRLAPPSGTRPLDLRDSANSSRALPFEVPQMESLTTAGAGLAIVVGLFLLCAWLFRRSGPKATTPLPNDAVAVLGRVPIAASHFAHLLRLGNKLVLVAVSPDSVTTLAEVSDPTEVQHLLGLCLRTNPSSTSAEFQQVLQQLASEPAQGFLEKTSSGTSYKRAGRN